MDKIIWIGIIVALVIAIVSPFIASSNPDGLEGAMEKVNNSGANENHLVESPMPDYMVPSLGENSPFSSSLAAIIGVIIVFAAAYGLGLLLKKRKT